MDDAEKYLLRQQIACALDHPSVFMGGPSQQSIHKAIRIVEILSGEYSVTPHDAMKADAEHVRSWRTSAWDSLERT